MSPKKTSTRRTLKAERVQSRLSSRKISEQMKTAYGWKTADGRTAIVRTYTLPSFRCALSFVQHVGEIAEAHDHHADIDVRYRKVTLKLSTHSDGGLTMKDFDFVQALDHA